MSRWKVLIGSRSFGKASSEHVPRLEAAGCEVIPNGVGRAYRAAELREALVVNPYDIEGVAEALIAALAMPLVEQRERMRAMRVLLARATGWDFDGEAPFRVKRDRLYRIDVHGDGTLAHDHDPVRLIQAGIP